MARDYAIVERSDCWALVRDGGRITVAVYAFADYGGDKDAAREAADAARSRLARMYAAFS